MHDQRSSRLKNLMFKNNFLKHQTFDTERHLLNAFQRAHFPFLNSLGTYTRLEILLADINLFSGCMFQLSNTRIQER